MRCATCPKAAGCRKCPSLSESVNDWLRAPHVDMCMRCAKPFDGEVKVFSPDDIAGPFHLRCALARIANKVKK